MKVRFAGAAARAAGLRETVLGLHTALTVREVLAILGNLYPGFGDFSPLYPTQGLRVYLNDALTNLDARVADGDHLEITASELV